MDAPLALRVIQALGLIDTHLARPMQTAGCANMPISCVERSGILRTPDSLMLGVSAICELSNSCWPTCASGPRGVSKLWRVRPRTGRLGGHFLPRYFFRTLFFYTSIKPTRSLGVRGGANLWRARPPDRWSCFIRKKFNLNPKSPTVRGLPPAPIHTTRLIDWKNQPMLLSYLRSC
jgi:hypothetical protein